MKLSTVTVFIENLLLDPNNPRFADISDESLNIPEARYSDNDIQKLAFDKMMNPKFDVQQLANSIETVGFLPVDNIVTKQVGETDTYVVVEGNRRATAIKYIIKQKNNGNSTVSDEILLSLQKINVLVVDNAEDQSENIGKIIQGIRNVSGIKEWDAYQKAQFINEMIEKGKEPITISNMIGMSVKEVNRYYKTYRAMIQFKKDVEFGNAWKHSYFSHFDELLKRPVLRNHFGWDEDKYQFNKQNEIRRFYEWMIPDEEDKTALNDAKDVRKLVDFIDDPKALAYLDEKNIDRAINYNEQKNFNAQKATLNDCLTKIEGAIGAFKYIISEELDKQLTKDELEELDNKIKDMGEKVARLKKLKAE